MVDFSDQYAKVGNLFLRISVEGVVNTVTDPFVSTLSEDSTSGEGHDEHRRNEAKSRKSTPGLDAPRAQDALRTFEQATAGIREYVTSLQLSLDKLERELTVRRASEQSLSERLGAMDQIGRELEERKMELLESQRVRAFHEDAIAKERSEAAIRTEALEHTRKELADALKSLQDIKSEVDDLRGRLSESDRKKLHFEQLSELRDSQLQEKVQALKETSEKLLSHTAAVSEFQAKLRDTEAALHRLNEEFREQSETFKETQWELHQQRELLRFTQADLARRNDTNTAQERELTQRDTAIRQLQQDVVAKDEDIRVLQDRLAETEMSLDRLDKSFAEKSSALNSLQEVEGDLREELRRTTSALRALEAATSRKDSDLQNAQSELVQLRQLVRAHSVSIETLRADAATKSQALSNEQNKRRESEARLEREQNERYSLQVELAQVYEQMAERNEQLVETETKLADTTQEFQRLRAAHEDEERKRIHAERIAERSEQELEQKTSSLRESQAEALRMKEKHDLLLLKFDHIRATLVEVQYKAGKQKETIDLLNGQIKNLPTIERLESEIEALRAQLATRDAGSDFARDGVSERGRNGSALKLQVSAADRASNSAAVVRKESVTHPAAASSLAASPQTTPPTWRSGRS